MDENKNIQMVCNRCKKKAAVKNMRMDTDGKNLICMECYNKQPDKKNLPPLKGESKTSIGVTSSSETKTQYQCERCKYKFMRKKDWIDKRCPYCGNTSVREIEGATKILKDSNDKRFDI